MLTKESELEKAISENVYLSLNFLFRRREGEIETFRCMQENIFHLVQEFPLRFCKHKCRGTFPNPSP